jgi:hypothetical protein
VFFIEKSYTEKLEKDPELAFTRSQLLQAKLLETTDHFWVVRPVQ